MNEPLSKIRWEESPQLLKIKHRWFREVHIFVLFVGLFWNGLLGLFYLDDALPADIPTVFWVLPALHVATGLVLFYYALAGLLNATTVKVAQNHLSVCHRPMPWVGNKRLICRDLVQLYVREHRSQSISGTHLSYQVCALLGGSPEQKTIVLLRGLATPEQAQFFEQKIEKYLHIQDAPVQGEYPKP
ncbi:MAG: hypothetical protein ACFCUI_07850 [Bernardetiaceae bacterium]